MTEKKQWVNEIKDKETVQSVFVVKYSAKALGKTGKAYMNLVLMDKTGEIDARIFEDVENYFGQVVRDQFVKVEGRCQLFQGRKQIIINRIHLLREEEVEASDFIPVGQIDPEALYQKILSAVASMKDPYYRALAEAVLKDDPEIAIKIKRAPAAKSVHHAYQGGLIEHMVSITEILEYFAKHYQGLLDRDLLFLGGFFHDIGKLWELAYDRVTDYTTEGKLIGHLVMGVELVTRKIIELESQPGRLPGVFPEDKKLLVKHLILSHHGELEYGSPKRPKCLEALIVHYVDDLDSKVNAIKTFIQQDQTPGQWTGLHRMYERYFFKPEWALSQDH